MPEFYSHGKLLISSEYAVLDGAKALALPTRFGQSLTITKGPDKGLNWKSFSEKNELWFEAKFQIKAGLLSVKHTTNIDVATRLLEILNKAQGLSEVPVNLNGMTVETRLEFNRHWGLGSSSTLINNLASWFQIDAFELLSLTFGGSGYDIACAKNSAAISYQLINNLPQVKTLELDWPFKDHLYFVYLNRKQNSRLGISEYRSKKSLSSASLNELSHITDALIHTKTLADFESLISRHNAIISDLIGQPLLAETEFYDFEGSIKNLGAWGGDFIMASSQTDPHDYFKQKGYGVLLSFNEMIL